MLGGLQAPPEERGRGAAGKVSAGGDRRRPAPAGVVGGEGRSRAEARGDRGGAVGGLGRPEGSRRVGWKAR